MLRLSDIEPEVIFGNKYYIQRMSMDGEIESTRHSGIEVHVLDIDTVENMVYFYDLTYHIFRRSPLNDTDMEIVNIHSALYTEGMAIDWVGRYVALIF